MIYGIITASGASKRFGANKIFIHIKGKPALYHSVNNFLYECGVILITARAADMEMVREIVKSFKGKKIKVLKGGRERQDSIKNALYSIKKINPADKVLIHDAARPFVTRLLIKRVLSSLEKYSAVIPVIDITDTVKQVKGKAVVKTLDRNILKRVQTPQGFNLKLLKEVYGKAYKENFYATDDSALVEKYTDEKIKTVFGDNLNIKLTVKDDLKCIEQA